MPDPYAKTQLSLVDYLVLTVLDGVDKSARLGMIKVTHMWSFPFFALQLQQPNFKKFPLVSTGNCFKLMKIKTALMTVFFLLKYNPGQNTIQTFTKLIKVITFFPYSSDL